MEILFTLTASCSLSYHFTIDLINSSKNIPLSHAAGQLFVCLRKAHFYASEKEKQKSSPEIWKQQGGKVHGVLIGKRNSSLSLLLYCKVA